MSTVQVFTAICLLLAHPVTVSASATFLYPTGGQIFDVRDTVVVEYQSTYKDPALALWYENSSCSFQPDSVTWNTSADQHGQYNLDLLDVTRIADSDCNTTTTFPVVFWLELIANNGLLDYSDGTNSSAFTITSQAAAMAVTYAATATNTATQATTSSTSSAVYSSSPTETATPKAPEKASPDPIHNPKLIAEAVGVAAGVLILAAVAFLILRFRRRTRQLERHIATSSGPNQDRAAVNRSADTLVAEEQPDLRKDSSSGTAVVAEPGETTIVKHETV